ncbi:MAG: DUF2764 family protein [Bacteroidales bacterium]|nr:DUF2764 family protein [Bacteroidales bacterium]
MANYEYIIASVPSLSPDWRFGEGRTLDGYLSWIKSQLSPRDSKTVDTVVEGFGEESLDREFYEAALKSPNRFVREYFTFDLKFRNAKARFVNKAFGRPEAADTIDIDAGEFEEEGKVAETLSMTDILARERGLDSIRWEKISSLTTFSYFDMDAILGLVAKMLLVDRWRSLDEEAGRDMFDTLLSETRGSYGGVNYNAPSNE